MCMNKHTYNPHVVMWTQTYVIESKITYMDAFSIVPRQNLNWIQALFKHCLIGRVVHI